MEYENLEDPESDSAFAFETEHLALRGNEDYCELIKYIVKLEAQKIHALQDIEKIAHEENEALKDPVQFIEKLKAGNLKFPERQIIDDLPDITWHNYGIDTFDADKELKQNSDDDFPRVRGRKFTDSKPETFNQLWSLEEQKRLEELLEVYPEEPIEARRYKKIAQALGTRTPIQVMSRLQKYFAKLAKAGLPIPGRLPKKVNKDKNKSVFYKKSTFFPQLHVPVKMEDPCNTSDIGHTGASMESGDDKQYMLELLKLAKAQRLLDETSPVYQINTMCVGCQKTGFLGARWTDNAGTDYCTDCLVQLLPSERLTPVRSM